MKLTIKEAILKSLDEINKVTNYLEVYNHIVAQKYYDFGPAKTPASTVSALLGEFIRKEDTRVKRIKQAGGTYSYYLTKNEHTIPIEVLSGNTEEEVVLKGEKTKTFSERDLHLLLSSYLKSLGIFSKTIFHEQSTYSKDSNQTWTHPDMVGAFFLSLKSEASRNLLKAVNRGDAFKLSSYELKKEINSDAELKKAFFQAVSNSSWANYGYLVAFEFSDGIKDEMERLNQSFGIGFIKLNANPFESRILHQARYHELDFQTIDKLCQINQEFRKFIGQMEKLMTADERFFDAVQKELESLCDGCLKEEAEIDEYCKKKGIPIEKEGDNVSLLFGEKLKNQ